MRSIARSPARFGRALYGFLGIYASSAPDGGVVQPDDHPPLVRPLALRTRSARPTTLNVLIPRLRLESMSGGPNTAINLTYRLARDGTPVRYLSTDVEVEPDEEKLWQHVQRVTGIDERLPHVSFGSVSDREVATEIGDRDVFLATAWWTAHLVKEATRAGPGRPFVYMIQDFEAGFYPWSSLHALALETYGLDFLGVVNESLLLEHLVAGEVGRFAGEGFAERCSVFEPAVDRRTFYPECDTGRERLRLLFYARPNAPRNLYELGLLALKRACEAGVFPAERWELFAIGEPVPTADLGGKQILRPLPWFGYGEYARLVRGSDAGLALMLSPHTGYPALEMAACDVSVVTNTFSVKTAERLRSLSESIVPAAPTVDDIVRALAEAAGRAGQPPRRPPSLPASWDEVLDRQTPILRGMIDECVATKG